MAESKYKLTPQQQKAAELLTENEFALKGEKRSLEDIAEEVGVTVRALYNWRQDTNFNDYTAHIAENISDSYRPLVESQLIKAIAGTSNNGVPSIKAIELWLRKTGNLVDRSVVTQADGSAQPRMSQDELREKIAGLSE